MKKSILFFGLALFVATQVFAIKLPEGSNVRVTDLQEDGDDIIKATLAEPSIINTPIGQLKVKGDVHFYKSGALKQAELAEATVIKAPIEQLEAIDTSYEKSAAPTGHLKAVGVFSFYESGVLESCHLNGYQNVNIETDIGKLTITSSDGSSREPVIIFYESGCIQTAFYGTNNYMASGNLLTGLGKGKIKCFPITFYDSGNPTILKLHTYKTNDAEYESDIGKIKVRDWYTVTQYPSGKIKSFYPSEGSYVIKTPIGDILARGGNYSDSDSCTIILREDGSLVSFYTDELVREDIAGTKVTIPTNSYISFYKNGNIRDFTASNKTSFTIGNKKIEFPENSTFRASEDGTKIIECPFFPVYRNGDTQYSFNYYGRVLQLYDNGVPKKFSYNKKNLYLDDAAKYFVEPVWRGDGKGYECTPIIKNGYDRLEKEYYSSSKYFCFLQDEDNQENVGMLYFSDSGLPSSYALYKLDENGELLLDEFNDPIIDAEHKKKFKKVEKGR